MLNRKEKTNFDENSKIIKNPSELKKEEIIQENEGRQIIQENEENENEENYYIEEETKKNNIPCFEVLSNLILNFSKILKKDLIMFKNHLKLEQRL